jgi:AcrR family transcriptional regulator
VDAALQLFATKGYDAAGTEEIAQAAGVSARTFFRYFPTKETVLFFGEYDFVRSFAGVLLAQPRAMSDIDAASAALVTLAPGINRLRKRINLYEQAIASSLVLRGREQLNQEQHIRAMAEAFAQRRDLRRPDRACHQIAALCHLLLRRSLDEWLTGPATRGLGVAIASEFELMAEQLQSPVVDKNKAAGKR